MGAKLRGRSHRSAEGGVRGYVVQYTHTYSEVLQTG